ncbi:hypothetical protein JCM21714_1629 [Gracilibacillus boraciitolerans JCM 21714]|uniref:Uncharacterized protein n=1 Tax=Gracilibacillus boraciitolerans JCM 21714 TaxID=1298598 RepID=W4VHI8_9BACI|nr:hypothetical protein [Gracilibacillus boraciitolerans]GAE92621.1 hypothetical protein JCM21714_1629 [Gracilibacillus boraciitolerans JCM 21714]
MQIKWSRTYTLLLVMILVLFIGLFYFLYENWMNSERDALKETKQTLSQQQEFIDIANKTDRSMGGRG